MALVQKDLIPGRGDQLVTYDSATNLDWLNLTVTANRSYLEILAGFGGFMSIFGFQYATQSQVTTLFQHAGVSKFSGSSPGLDYANHYGIEVLQDLMNGKSMRPLPPSPPFPGSVSVDTAGMVKYGGAGLPTAISPIEGRQTHLNLFEPEKSYTDIGALTQKAGDRSPFIGSYLVKRSLLRLTSARTAKGKITRRK